MANGIGEITLRQMVCGRSGCDTFKCLVAFTAV